MWKFVLYEENKGLKLEKHTYLQGGSDTPSDSGNMKICLLHPASYPCIESLNKLVSVKKTCDQIIYFI